MSQDIILEVNFFFHSFLLGVLITFLYDWFLILRRMIRHTIFTISLEDFFFWVACALGVFYVLYRENNGILRWFAVFGATVGMLVYKKLCSVFFVPIVSDFLLKVYYFLMKPMAFIAKKMAEFLVWLRKKTVLLLKYVKKQLTVQWKLIKIILCKQVRRKENRRGKKNGISQKAAE